jgi:hypothetical protein
MRSTESYYLYLPLHKDIIPARKDPLVVKNVAVAEPHNRDLVNAEDQIDSNAKENQLQISGSSTATPSIPLSTSTPATDPFLLTLQRMAHEPDQAERTTLFTALEQQYKLLIIRVYNSDIARLLRKL